MLANRSLVSVPVVVMCIQLYSTWINYVDRFLLHCYALKQSDYYIVNMLALPSVIVLCISVY